MLTFRKSSPRRKQGALSRLRGKLTVCSIAVGVFAVVLIAQIGAIGSGKITETLSNMGINSVLVQPVNVGFAVSLNEEDMTEISRLQGVRQVTPLMAANTQVVLKGEGIPVLAWGINADAKAVISLKAQHGRLITAKDTAAAANVCVVDENIALTAYGRANIVGKTASILVGGQYRDFTVIGVAQSGLSALQSTLEGIIPGFVYIPFTTMQNFTGRMSYDKIAVLTAPTADGAAVSDNIIEKLEQMRGGYAGLSASNLLSQKAQLDYILSTVTLALSSIAGISIVVAGLTVMTTMMAAVSERTREIGIKKSIGARNRDVLFEFLKESALLSFTGGVAGSALAVAVAGLACLLIGLDFAPNWTSAALPVLLAVVVGAVFGAYPAIKAARLEPITALKNQQ
jgi:putative ABC transport system permease protein